MARSIKFLNDDYIDTEGVVYNPPGVAHVKLTDYLSKAGHNYYDSNAYMSDISVRKEAMLHVINESLLYNIASGTFVVRYAGGYYYTYIFGYHNDAVTVMEIVYGGTAINIFSGDLTTLNFVRSI